VKSLTRLWQIVGDNSNLVALFESPISSSILNVEIGSSAEHGSSIRMICGSTAMVRSNAQAASNAVAHPGMYPTLFARSP